MQGRALSRACKGDICAQDRAPETCRFRILFECLTLAKREKQFDREEILSECQDDQGHLESKDVDVCDIELVGK